MKRILIHLKPYTRELLLSQVFMIISTVSGLMFPWLLRNFFNNLLTNEDYNKLPVLTGSLLMLFIVSHFFNFLKEVRLGILGEKIVKNIRISVYEKLQKLSIGFYSKQKSGDIISRLTNDINLFQMALSSGFTHFLRQFISLAFIIFMLVKIDIPLTLLAFSMFPLIVVISKKMGSMTREVSKKMQKKLGDLTSFTSESILGINIIKTFVLEKTVNRMYKEENEKLFGHSVKNIKIRAKSNLIIGFLTSLQLLSLIGFGGYRVFSGNISAGDFIAFLLYIDMVMGPVSMLSNFYMDVQKSMAAINRIFEVLSSDEEVKDREKAIVLDKVSGDINFKKVFFSYGKGGCILENASMTIKSGEKAALVGKSGAGKSTIINLIPRFFELNNGDILIDGISIKNIKVKSLRSNIAIVPQDTNLFGISIKDNILCGNPGASFEMVIEASKKANAHEFIQAFEYKYNTVVGERGVTLSGGQRQRIAIARAFLKNPPILLLDEATSSLDTYSEMKVVTALNKLMKGRTTIMIAHRLSTVIDFDCIYVVDKGKIIGKGKHEELLHTCKYYKDLYFNQYKKAL